MKTTSIRSLAIAASMALALPLSLNAAVASNDDGPAKLDAELAKSIEQQGYAIRSVEKDEGRLEIDAVKDGRRFEIYADPITGKILRIKEDD